MKVNLKRSTVLRVLILIFALTIFVSCGGNNMRPEKELKNFTKEIENGNLANLGLTIFYLSPSTLTLYPLSVDDLINSSNVHKVVINGSRLDENIELLKQINNDALVPVQQKSRINARIYYVFENNKERKIFDVAMWGETDSIFVNGCEVKENDIFYDVIMPFLPEDAVKELETYLKRGKQE